MQASFEEQTVLVAVFWFRLADSRLDNSSLVFQLVLGCVLLETEGPILIEKIPSFFAWGGYRV